MGSIRKCELELPPSSKLEPSNFQTTEAQQMFEQFYARYQRQHSVTNSNSNRPPSGDSSGITVGGTVLL